MSDVLKISGPIKVGSLAANPSNPAEGFIYFNTTDGTFKFYENGAFREVSAEQAEAHLNGGASKHDATEIDYERVDGSKKNIQATSDDVETALTDLDDAINTLNATPTNYTPAAATVAGHLSGVDTALGAASGDAADTTYTPAVLTDWDLDADPGNVDDALDQLAERVDDNEAAIGNKAESSVVTEIDGNVDDLITLSGVAENASNLGTFTGTTIADTSTVKTALQSLETSVETKANNTLNNLGTTDLQAVDLNGTGGIYPDTNNTKPIGSSTFSYSRGNIRLLYRDNVQSIDVHGRGLKSFTGGSMLTWETELGALVDLDMNSNKIVGLAAPTADTDAANKAYVDAIKQGMDVKDSVRVASTANVALTGGATLSIDGVALANGNRVLLKDQSTASQNGLYEISGLGATYSLTRTADADTSAEVTAGLFTFVTEGTTNADSGWILTTNDAIVLDTTALAFSQFSGAGQITAGDGLTKTGNSLSVNVDGNGLEISGDNLIVELDGSTLSKSASGLRVAAQTVSRAMATDGSGNITTSATTDTELGYVSGVTSAIQTQLNGKLANVVEDTTPQLGGALDVLAQPIESSTSEVVLAGQDSVRRAKQASKADFIEEEYIHSIALAASQTNTVIADLTFAHATYEGMEITFKVKEATSGDIEIGTIRVVTNGTAVAINTVSTETADTGVTWSAVVNGANVNVRYSSGANAATMRADVKRFLA